MTEKKLLQAYVSDRDPEAINWLIRKHRHRVFGICLRILGHVPDAEDTTQEVFLALIKNAGSVNSSVAGWLHGCAVKKCSLLIRSRQNGRKREKHKSSDGVHLDPDTADAEAANILRGCLSRLNRAERALLVQHIVHGRPQRALAAELTITQQAVAKRIGKTMRQLRRMLLEKGIGFSFIAVCLGWLRRSAKAVVPTRVQTWLARLGSSDAFANIALRPTTLDVSGKSQAASRLVAVVLTLGATMTLQQEVNRISRADERAQAETSSHVACSPKPNRHDSPPLAALPQQGDASNRRIPRITDWDGSEGLEATNPVRPSVLSRQGGGADRAPMSPHRNDLPVKRQWRRKIAATERVPLAQAPPIQVTASEFAGHPTVSEARLEQTHATDVPTAWPGKRQEADETLLARVGEPAFLARRQEGRAEDFMDSTDQLISRRLLRPWAEDTNLLSAYRVMERISSPVLVGVRTATAVWTDVGHSAPDGSLIVDVSELQWTRLWAPPSDVGERQGGFVSGRDRLGVPEDETNAAYGMDGATTRLLDVLVRYPGLWDQQRATMKWMGEDGFTPGGNPLGDLTEAQESEQWASADGIGTWQDGLLPGPSPAIGLLPADAKDCPAEALALLRTVAGGGLNGLDDAVTHWDGEMGPEIDMGLMPGLAEVGLLVSDGPTLAAIPPDGFDGWQLDNFGAGNSLVIPEPVTIVLLAFGSTFLLTTKKHPGREKGKPASHRHHQ